MTCHIQREKLEGSERLSKRFTMLQEVHPGLLESFGRIHRLPIASGEESRVCLLVPIFRYIDCYWTVLFFPFIPSTMWAKVMKSVQVEIYYSSNSFLCVLWFPPLFTLSPIQSTNIAKILWNHFHLRKKKTNNLSFHSGRLTVTVENSLHKASIYITLLSFHKTKCIINKQRMTTIRTYHRKHFRVWIFFSLIIWFSFQFFWGISQLK